MATLNVRNESNKFVKEVGGEYVQKPADNIEDVTSEFTSVVSDKTFSIFSDVNCNTYVGEYKISFKSNDGVYVNLSNISDVKIECDFNFDNQITVASSIEEKLLDWSQLNDNTVINVNLKLV